MEYRAGQKVRLTFEGVLEAQPGSGALRLIGNWDTPFTYGNGTLVSPFKSAASIEVLFEPEPEEVPSVVVGTHGSRDCSAPAVIVRLNRSRLAGEFYWYCNGCSSWVRWVDITVVHSE